MKQIVLFLAFLAMASLANAQEYSCIPPEHKTFFTNGKDYLRGMRIDSAKYVGQNKIYYPFKTARVTLNHGLNQVDEYADTTGGSWWGGMIIEDTLTGITAIPTRYGDTVWMDTRAGLNDQWILYKDTAARYYEAKIIDLDTASIAGISDSVKRIKIIAKDSNVVATSDPLNGLELILSQHHGLFQAIDFYLFPYKGFESNPDYYFEMSKDYASNTNTSLVFTRVPFRFPRNMDMYNYEVGDVIAKVHQDYVTNYRSTGILKITGKIVTDSSIIFSSDTNTFTVNDLLMFNAEKMPEEFYNSIILLYSYKDSSYCIQSPKYEPVRSAILQDGFFDIGEWGVRDSYKETVGHIHHSQENDTWSYYESIVSVKRDGIACNDGNWILGLAKFFAANKNILVYPNPANNTVTVSSESDNAFSVQILDLTGRLLIQQNCRQGQLTIPVENLPNGLYLLKVLSGNEMLTKKLSVLH